MVAAVLQSGSRSQVTLQKGLDNTKLLNWGEKSLNNDFIPTSNKVCALITATTLNLKKDNWNTDTMAHILHCNNSCSNYLRHFSTDLGCHVVCNTEGQVLLDALHAVAVLLLRGPQVLLQGPSHWREDGLGSFPWVHHVTWGFLLLLLLHSLDMCECLFYCHHQTGRKHSISDRNRIDGISIYQSYITSLLRNANNGVSTTEELQYCNYWANNERDYCNYRALRLRTRLSCSASS